MEKFMLRNDKRADPKTITLSDVIDFHFNLAKIHINTKIEKVAGNSRRADELYEEGMELVSDFAYSAELAGYNWAQEEFFSKFPQYAYFIYRGEKDARNDAFINSCRAEAGGGKVFIYCPRGCNHTQAPASDPWDECASCGAIMRPEGEEMFYDSLTLARQVM
ncbi:MAG TPA: hypothetical protein DD671_20110 [Balneolaceae bacterium]|nr:hypothetical protein [Balneolaceae bacterium]